MTDHPNRSADIEDVLLELREEYDTAKDCDVFNLEPELLKRAADEIERLRKVEILHFEETKRSNAFEAECDRLRSGITDDAKSVGMREALERIAKQQLVEERLVEGGDYEYGYEQIVKIARAALAAQPPAAPIAPVYDVAFHENQIDQMEARAAARAEKWASDPLVKEALHRRPHNGSSADSAAVLTERLIQATVDYEAGRCGKREMAEARAAVEAAIQPQTVATPAFDALAAEVIDRISERYNKLAASPLGMATAWERKASGGKPLLYGGKRGLLASGTIATWDEFDLIADVINNLPTLLAACSVSRPESK